MAAWGELLGEARLVESDGKEVGAAELSGRNLQGVLLYFSASWCGPCKQFTPALVRCYRGLRAAGKPIECVFVSACRSQRDYDAYRAKMPFLAAPYAPEDLRQALLRRFRVRSFPTMVMWDPLTGKSFVVDARRAVSEDPRGEQLPWTAFRRPEYCLDRLQHTNPMPGPVWRDRVFYAVFAEGHLQSTETTGGDKSRCGDVAALLHVQHYVADNIARKRPEWLGLCSADDVKAVGAVNEVLKRCLDVSREMAKIKQPQQLSVFLKSFVKSLREMKSGEEVLVPGGWQDTDSGHCIMHVFKRQRDEAFTFSVHNAGKGVKFHRASAGKPPGMKRELSAVFHNVPAARVLDHGFWYMFFKIHVTKSDDHRHEVLYDVLYPHLLGMPFAKATFAEAKGINEPGVDFFAPQRAETCYFTSVERAYCFLLAQHGLNKDKITQFLFASRRALINMAHSDVRQIPEMPHSDARLLRIACQQLAGAAAAELRAKRLTGANLAEVLAKIEQIQSMILKRAEGIDAAPVPEVDIKAQSPWSPLRGFGVYSREENVEQFAGWQDAQPHNHLIDMAKLPTEKVESKGIVGAIRMCLDLCKALSRKHTSNSYFYICSLIQQLFVDVLPMPVPPSERKSLSDCAWASIVTTRKEYLQMVSDLQLLARYYTAASRSVQSNRPFRGANTVVMACLMACLDATVRLYSTDQPSVVAMVINGTQHLYSGAGKNRARGPSPVSAVTTEAEFKALEAKAAEEGKVLVVDFFATWCGPCKQIAPVYANLARKLKGKPIMFAKLDAEKVTAVSRKYNVRSFPNFKFLFGGRVVGEVRGASPEGLERKCAELVGKLESGGLEEKEQSLIEADESKSQQLVSFGYAKSAVDWALRNTNNNVQAAAEKLMDLDLGTLPAMLLVEEEGRKLIRANNEKIRARNDEARRKREAKRAEAEGAEGAEAQGDDAAGSAGKKKKETFNREAAMQLLQPDFYLSMMDGYGTHIDELTDTCLLLEPSLAVARGHMLRYFLAQEKCGKRAIFNFKTRVNCTTFLSKNSPTMDMIKTLCNVLGYDLQPKDEEKKTMDDGISFIEAATWYLTHPKSPLAKEHPELLALRDTALLFRVLVTDTTHRRHVKLQRWTTSHAQVAWKIKEPGGVNSAKTQVDLNAACFNQEFVCVECKPYRSPADPKNWLRKGLSLEDITEDDVLHKRQLPTFDNALSQEDSEYLLSALTAPYVRIPIILSFFSTRDRVSALINGELRGLLESVLFEPLRWTPETAPEIRFVPAKDDSLIGAPAGLLLNELEHAPGVTLTALLTLLEQALEFNTGRFTSSSSSIILFLIRCIVGTERYLVYLLDAFKPGGALPKPRRDELEAFRVRIRKALLGSVKPVLVQWEQQAQQENDLRSSCVMNAHLALLFQGVRAREMSLASAQPMMSHLGFLQTWHSPGLGQGAQEEERKRRQREAKKEQKKKLSKADIAAAKARIETPLLVPEHVYFDMLALQRRGLVAWFARASKAEVDAVMQGILRAATRDQTLRSSGWVPRADEPVGVFRGAKEEIEINVQSVELHFRNSHIEPVPNHMARTDDFALIFGKEPQHCALVAAHEHRQWVRLVGRSFNVRRWDERDKKLTLVNMPAGINGGAKGFRWDGVEYSRAVPQQVGPEEGWIMEPLSAAILTHYGKWDKVPYVKKARFFMPKDPVDPNAYAATLIAFDEGTWRVFRVVRHRRVCEMYVLLEHGRRMYPSLAYTTDSRFCRYSMRPDTDDRGTPPHPLLQYAAGRIVEKTPIRDSVVISRDVSRDNIEETFTPERLLRGVVPAALTENFFFWQRDKDDHFVGYPKEIANPDWQFKIRIRLIDFKETRLSGVVTRSPLTRQDVKSNTEISAKNFFDVKMELADDDPMVVAMNNSKVEVIVSQGYPLHLARQVMEQFRYDLPVAQAFLSNPKNKEKLAQMTRDFRDIKEAEAESSASGSGGSGLAEGALVAPKLVRAPSQLKEDMLVLFDLESASGDSVIGRLVSALTRIEDLGYILVWTDSHVVDVGTLCQITLVELPRLKLRFVPREGPDGTTRLYSLDHSSLFLSDYRNDRLDAVCTGIPHSLVMQNAARELFLLVPNCPLYRPHYGQQPFAARLKLDHRDPDWLENMASRYFLYPVHGSHTFLVTPTLSSAMYLILVRLMSRQYKKAFRVVQSCEADRTLSKAELWVFKQLRNANRDQHPNAHAVRLKFSLVVMFCGASIDELWELQSEYKQYIQKLEQVSSTCRLSMDEESMLLEHIRSSNEFAQYEKVENQLDIQRGALDAELANRSNFISMLLSGRGRADAKATFTHGQNDMQYGEQTAWDRVEARTDEFYRGFQPHLRTWRAQCEYYKPRGGALRMGSAVETLNEMWKDQVTGVVRQLGFFFVAELLLGRVRVHVAEPSSDDAQTLGKLFARILLLKNTNWGGRTNFELTSSYNDNSWYPYVILGLLHHWRPKHGQLPTFDRYYQLGEGMSTFGFAGRTHLGDYLNQMVVKLQATQRSDERKTALMSPVFNPPVICSIPVPAYQSVKPLPQVADCACDERTIRPFRVVDGEEKAELSADDVKWMRSQPLGPVGLDAFVRVVEKKAGLDGKLPFDLSKHEAADSHVAREMLKRLEKDMKLHADMENSKKVLGIVGLLESDLGPIGNPSADPERVVALANSAVARLESLVSKLLALRKTDAEQVETLSRVLLRRANRVELKQSPHLLLGGPLEDPLDDKGQDSKGSDDAKSSSGDAQAAADEKQWSNDITKAADAGKPKPKPKPTEAQLAAFEADAQRLLYLVERQAHRESKIWLEYLSACVLAKDARAELTRLNPFLPAGAEAQLIDLLIAFMLRVNRIGCIDRCLKQAETLVRKLKGMDRAISDATASERKELQKYIGHNASQLATLVAAKRHCVGRGVAEKKGDSDLDPRYLIFEYLFNILIRRKQVVLVNTFLRANRRGDSLVRQMIMGAGKSTVVGPMLALILADGKSLVTVVVPSALLEMSRNVMRARFTRVIPKRVHTFSFDRSCVWVAEVAKMYSKLKDARATRGVVVSTSEAVKSLMLKHIELLDAMRCAPLKLTEVGEKRLRIKSVMADEIARIMRLWKDNGVLILDEVDLLLHPLRSELNFPIGPKKPLELSPQRWEMPIFLLDAIFYASTGRASVSLAGSAQAGGAGGAGGSVPAGIRTFSSFAQQVLAGVRSVLSEGIKRQFLQTSPHIVLLDPAWYQRKLKPALAPWVLLWLRAKQHVQMTLSDAHALAYLTGGPNGEASYLGSLQESGRPSPIEETHSVAQKKMLNLAHDWLQSYTPHVLTKIDRVSYGLLLKEDLERVDKNTPASRKLMAVPFVGKDVPSHASEFAQPDVLLGLTVLAYRYEGLRVSDVIEVVKLLQDKLREEVGPLSERPSARKFAQWLSLGRERLRKEWMRSQQKLLLERQESEDEKLAPLDLKRSLSQQERDRRQMERSQQSLLIDEKDAPVYNVNPLHIFQLSDRFQLDNLFKLVSGLPELVHYYLDQMVFPATLQHQETKISASGQELGGDILFPRRVGFSGTPSDLLPLELGKCGYEKGSEGSILHTLVSPSVVSYEFVQSSEKHPWTVRGLLRSIATANPPFHCLIDTGALVTGMTNDEVARFLMQNGLERSMEACVFLDREDRQMALLKGSGKVIPLKQCGVAPSRRFSFYDQVHTTGMDIKQAMNARAVVTLGKDMTHRDFSQGCYRMRGIGRGQTVRLLVIPEVLKLIRKEVGDSGSLQRDVNAWLLVNSMRSEKLQFMQLCIQNTANVFRKRCHRALLESTNVTPQQALAARRHWRFQEDYGKQTEDARKSVAVFREKVDFSVRGKAVAEQRSFVSVLEDMVKENQSVISGDQAAQDTILRVQMLASNAGNPTELSRQRSLNQEMVQEAEQEAQKQKEKQVEQEQQVQVRFSREDESHVPWPVKRLAEEPSGLYREDGKAVLAQTVHERHAFYRLGQLSLRGLGKSDLREPPQSMYVSHNYYRPEWASTGQRRLKNIVCVLEWQRPAPSGGPGSGTAASNVSKTQDASIKRLFELLDFQGEGRVRTANLGLVMAMLGEDASPDELKAQARRLDPKESGGIEFPAFQSLFTQWSRGGAGGPQGSLLRRYVCVSLKEAETIRRLIHSGHPVLRAQSSETGRVGLALRLLQGGDAIDRSLHFAQAASRPATMRSALACFRFVNCDFFYDDTELLMLMRALQRTPAVVRRAFFENALRCRRRDRQRWNDTPLAKVFASPDHYTILTNRAVLLRTRAALLAKGLLLRDAFDVFDSVGDGRLFETELNYALGEGFLGLGLSDKEVSRLVRHCDKINDGTVSKYEFLESVCLETDYKEDERRFATGDFKQFPSLKLPDDLKERYTREGEQRRKRLADERDTLRRMETRIAEEKRALQVRPIFEAIDRGQKGFVTHSDIEFFLPDYPIAEFKSLAVKAGAQGAQQISFKQFCKVGLSVAKDFLRRNRLRSARSAPDRKSGSWNCPSCTLLNPDSSSNCSVCNTRRPSGDEKKAPAADEDDEVDLASLEAPVWVCTACTTRNKRELANCSMCGSKRPKQEKKELFDVLWECPACTKQNTRYADQCSVCETPRPRRAQAAAE